MIKRLAFFFGVYLGKPILSTLFGLNRKKVVNGEIFNEALSSGRSVILCSWHGRLLFPFFFFRKCDYYAVAGLHDDAEIISRVGEKFGWKMIRGSSTKGGANAFQGIVGVLSQNGTVVAITPDGPRGPKQKVKSGTTRAAVKTGAVVVPMSGQASRRWEIKNWDTFVVPKPFGKVWFVFGEPMEVESRGEAKEYSLVLEEALNRVQEMADARAIEKN